MSNYYIYGSPEDAEQIKAAFESKGFKTGINSFQIERNLYFSINGEVKIASTEPFISIIMNHQDYQLLKLPIEPIFKVGDKIKLHDGKEVYTVVEVNIDEQNYVVERNYKHTILFEKQDIYELVNQPKYHFGQLVAWNGCLGRITEVYEGETAYFYRVGTSGLINESRIAAADFRDENRILRGK